MTARVALRLARRNARRSKARTALILAMIFIPVALLTWLYTLTVQGPTRVVGERPLGRADAVVWGGPEWDVDAQQGGDGYSFSAAGQPYAAAQIADLAGPGARVIPYNADSVRYLAPYGYHDGFVVEVDLRDPMAQDIVRLTSGRLPQRPGEA